jgi:hypothetical protein
MCRADPTKCSADRASAATKIQCATDGSRKAWNEIVPRGGIVVETEAHGSVL